jgi:hypothetical protein
MGGHGGSTAPAAGGHGGSGGAPAAGGHSAGGPSAAGESGEGGEGGGAGEGAGGESGAGEMGSVGCPSSSIHNGNGVDQSCTTEYSVDECGASCAQITKPACMQCELDDIDAGNACYDDGVTGDGSSLLNIAHAMLFNGGTPTPAKVAAGIAYLECVRKTGCAQNGAVFVECYCGTSSSCTMPGSANGPCKAEMEAALETTEPSTIGTHFLDQAYAGGVVNVRLSCDKTQCQSACLD